MKALVLVAHGSRRLQSNDEVVTLTQQLTQRCQPQYAFVYPGFLELASPTIPESIQRCINQGATSVTVLPYFLNSGRHVSEDIPQLVKQSQQANPATQIHLAPHLGTSGMMLDLIMRCANTPPAS